MPGHESWRELAGGRRPVADPSHLNHHCRYLMGAAQGGSPWATPAAGAESYLALVGKGVSPLALSDEVQTGPAALEQRSSPSRPPMRPAEMPPIVAPDLR